MFQMKALYIFKIFPVGMLTADFVIYFFDLIELEGASESFIGHGDTQGTVE